MFFPVQSSKHVNVSANFKSIFMSLFYFHYESIFAIVSIDLTNHSICVFGEGADYTGNVAI